ncbi:multicopper oxidase family protein [Jiangella mangrovi]|uniref:FtsP/CotA-like multicopper oxidase with cupredoxin domain n=1 Tax=Jiangella mangrovi TaxID=1524084 RepID=A0A7W9LPE5_9ACTN|nr:multicopper oxidase family protein [Jiangella mangrovi]MBB5791290.1 FtsP/CotA-like multicopper oxidase with cupredoxin domain [Jiangella mangrovi]
MDHSHHHTHGSAHPPATPFPTDPAGLPEAAPPAIIEPGDGDTVALAVGPVAKRIGDTTVRMLAYNGSVPGPTLVVRQGTELSVDVSNHGDLETTVHWHGLRLDNSSDGVPHDTQAPIEVGGEFGYRLRFPDPGLYWYHPHIREDYTQELGLYGTILVRPADDGYWPRAHRDVVLTLDDLLLEDGRIAPFSPTETTHAAMGRFGNVYLTNGEPAPSSLSAVAGEVVRFWLVDTANTRVFNVRIPGARLKLVGGDSGRLERDEFVDEVLIAPSERAVVDVLFPAAGEYAIEHHTPVGTHRLSTVTVSAAVPPAPDLAAEFDALGGDPDLAVERAGLDAWLATEPHEVLSLVAEMRMDHGDHDMHHGHDMSHDMGHGDMGHGEATAGGIEWEDEMAEMNRVSTPATMLWSFVDPATGGPPDWRFTVGDRVKIRLVNGLDSDHPMHHPFHLHGAGRFLVLARDGVTEANLVWKDTILIRTGQTVDILFDVTNPGRWMAHCHIAEHMESGMMFGFTVDA